eukprot:TRINITY_DN35729_c0_g1_i3.p1 TRINITY_DN35729_c0_g1~~TRINITY_DN35729_c0_g1_i3.p1  ORF type:complete len:621 (-),score=87.85 TRINITY_DN35729_c0_g1_i3:142-1905(-)
MAKGPVVPTRSRRSSLRPQQGAATVTKPHQRVEFAAGTGQGDVGDSTSTTCSHGGGTGDRPAPQQEAGAQTESWLPLAGRRLSNGSAGGDGLCKRRSRPESLDSMASTWLAVTARSTMGARTSMGARTCKSLDPGFWPDGPETPEVRRLVDMAGSLAERVSQLSARSCSTLNSGDAEHEPELAMLDSLVDIVKGQRDMIHSLVAVEGSKLSSEASSPDANSLLSLILTQVKASLGVLSDIAGAGKAVARQLEDIQELRGDLDHLARQLSNKQPEAASPVSPTSALSTQFSSTQDIPTPASTRAAPLFEDDVDRSVHGSSNPVQLCLGSGFEAPSCVPTRPPPGRLSIPSVLELAGGGSSLSMSSYPTAATLLRASSSPGGQTLLPQRVTLHNVPARGISPMPSHGGGLSYPVHGSRGDPTLSVPQEAARGSASPQAPAAVSASCFWSAAGPPPPVAAPYRGDLQHSCLQPVSASGLPLQHRAASPLRTQPRAATGAWAATRLVSRSVSPMPRPCCVEAAPSAVPRPVSPMPMRTSPQSWGPVVHPHMRSSVPAAAPVVASSRGPVSVRRLCYSQRWVLESDDTFLLV